MELKKTYQDFEVEARALCAHYEIDPESRVMYPDPNGYAVCRWRAAWIGYAKQLHEHWILTKLVAHQEARANESN